MPITHEEFTAAMTERFGDDPADWAFVCPSCGDEATGAEIRDALAEHPRARNGDVVTFDHILGQECIGRTLPGKERGCDWAAYGLIPGPLAIERGGRVVRAFQPVGDPL